jgi:hypothetical protein
MKRTDGEERKTPTTTTYFKIIKAVCSKPPGTPLIKSHSEMDIKILHL